MADFCKQCSIHHFGEDFKELAGLDKDPTDDLFPVVLCEGCGYIQVDNDGKCISDDCLRKHGLPVVEQKSSQKSDPEIDPIEF